MTKRINKILWNGTEVPQAATRADGLDGLNLGELFIKNDPQEPGVYTRTTDGKVVSLGGGIDKYLHRLFVAIDANGNEIAPNDTTTPIASVRVNYGLWTEKFLSAKGMNSGGGSSEGGATTLGGLRNVAADADRTYDVAKMLVLEADSNLWTLKNLSELVGLDEDALAEYLVSNGYATEDDIESLRGDIFTTEGGATIIKKNLVSLKGGDGVIVKDYNTISLLVDTDTFGFGENNELELIKVDGGLY